MSAMDGRKLIGKSNGNKICVLLKMENISMDNQSLICYLTAVVRWDRSLGKVYMR